MKKMINDYVVHECSHYQTCRDLWKGQDDGTKAYPLFSCKDCVGYECYVRGYIDASRPKGKWSDESKDSLLCSACGKRVYKPFIGGFPTERTSHYYPNFCAFCGADMRKETEE